MSTPASPTGTPVKMMPSSATAKKPPAPVQKEDAM
jgi:hypothetical protein